MSESIAKLLARRARLLGPNVSTIYDDPVHIVRGEGMWLYDEGILDYLERPQARWIRPNNQ